MGSSNRSFLCPPGPPGLGFCGDFSPGSWRGLGWAWLSPGPGGFVFVQAQPKPGLPIGKLRHGVQWDTGAGEVFGIHSLCQVLHPSGAGIHPSLMALSEALHPSGVGLIPTGGSIPQDPSPWSWGSVLSSPGHQEWGKGRGSVPRQSQGAKPQPGGS